VNSGLEKALNCELTNCALPVLIQNQQTQVMRHVCIADSGEENPLILTRSGIDTYHMLHRPASIIYWGLIGTALSVEIHAVGHFKLDVGLQSAKGSLD